MLFKGEKSSVRQLESFGWDCMHPVPTKALELPAWSRGEATSWVKWLDKCPAAMHIQWKPQTYFHTQSTFTALKYVVAQATEPLFLILILRVMCSYVGWAWRLSRLAQSLFCFNYLTWKKFFPHKSISSSMLPYQVLRVYPWGWNRLCYVLESPDEQVPINIGKSWYDHLVV